MAAGLWHWRFGPFALGKSISCALRRGFVCWNICAWSRGSPLGYRFGYVCCQWWPLWFSQSLFWLLRLLNRRFPKVSLGHLLLLLQVFLLAWKDLVNHILSFLFLLWLVAVPRECFMEALVLLAWFYALEKLLIHFGFKIWFKLVKLLA